MVYIGMARYIFHVRCINNALYNSPQNVCQLLCTVPDRSHHNYFKNVCLSNLAKLPESFLSLHQGEFEANMEVKTSLSSCEKHVLFFSAIKCFKNYYSWQFDGVERYESKAQN